MSCFCVDNLRLLPDLGVDASLNLSATAQAALALYTQISLGIPDLPLPAAALSGTASLDAHADLSAALLAGSGLSIGALASIVAMAQLSAQASASLNVDLSTAAGVTALARLTATLDARMTAIAALDVNLAPWVQMAAINGVAADLTAMFNATLGGGTSAAFSVAAVPVAWGGSAVTALSALANPLGAAGRQPRRSVRGVVASFGQRDRQRHGHHLPGRLGHRQPRRGHLRRGAARREPRRQPAAARLPRRASHGGGQLLRDGRTRGPSSASTCRSAWPRCRASRRSPD